MSTDTENVVPLICLAYYLGMTESHSPNNLLRKALPLFAQRILPSWNETIKAFCSAEHILKQAVHLGLVDACLETIMAKTLIDPCLLGEPIKNSTNENHSDHDSGGYMPNARSRLFEINWQLEDLTTLSLQLYEPIIHTHNESTWSPIRVCGCLPLSLCKEVGIFSHCRRREFVNFKNNSQRDVIEGVERLLPNERGFFHAHCCLKCFGLQFPWKQALNAEMDLRSGSENN